MTRTRCVVYPVLVILVAWYGVMSACVCTGHAAARQSIRACYHCAAPGSDGPGVKVTPHHQCCGMERAPMVVERVSPLKPVSATGFVLVYSAVVHFGAEPHGVVRSPFPHAPPHDLPIYLTTQHFVI